MSPSKCSLYVSVITLHPIVKGLLFRMLRSDVELRPLVRELRTDQLTEPGLHWEPHLFLLDACSLKDQTIELSRLLRARCPGSRFLALLPAGDSGPKEVLQLLYAGIDGFLKITDEQDEEVFAAVRALLKGNIWYPPEIIAEYVRNTNLLLENQLRPNLVLTARENQILPLMIRHLHNKDIAGALRISERTVKFHVSNIFAKLGVENRSRLFAAIGAAQQTGTA